MYRKRSFRRPRRKILRRRAGKKGSVSTKIKKYVNRVIHRNIENKEFLSYGANQSIICASATTPSGIALIPAISQGGSVNNRIGDAVRLRRGVIRGYVNIKEYNATTNPYSAPYWIKIWICRNLQYAGQIPQNSLDYSTFFRTGGSNIAFQGNMLDMCLPVNEELWKVEATKTFRVGATYASATGPVGSNSYFDNSHMSVPFYFNYSKYTKKLLKFNDGSNSNLCTNHNLYFIVQAVYADGSTAGSIVPAEFHYTNRFEYEDA